MCPDDNHNYYYIPCVLLLTSSSLLLSLSIFFALYVLRAYTRRLLKTRLGSTKGGKPCPRIIIIFPRARFFPTYNFLEYVVTAATRSRTVSGKVGGGGGDALLFARFVTGTSCFAFRHSARECARRPLTGAGESYGFCVHGGPRARYTFIIILRV